MKRWFCSLCAVILILTMLPMTVLAAAPQPRIYLSTPTTGIKPGDTFTVEVLCRSMQVCTYTGGFTFDTDVLEVVSVEMSDAPVYTGAMISGVSTAEEANKAGTVGCYAVHTEENYYADSTQVKGSDTMKAATLMRVTFQVSEKAEVGAVTLQPYENFDGQQAPADCTGEDYTIMVLPKEPAEDDAALKWSAHISQCRMTLKQGDEVVWTNAAAPLGKYSLSLAPGQYVLEVSKEGTRSRSYPIEITAGQDELDLGNVSSTPPGDTNGTGITDAADMQCLFEHLSTGEYSGTLNEEDSVAVSDVNGDNAINILDYQALYEMIAQEG